MPLRTMRCLPYVPFSKEKKEVSLMTTPTTTATAARDSTIWETLLERLADSDDDAGQLAALRVLAELDPDDLPIVEITTVLLDQTQDEDGTLHLADADDLWSEGLNLIECDPEIGRAHV